MCIRDSPCPWPAPRQGCRRDGIPTYPLPCPARGRHIPHLRGLVACPSRARSPGDSRGTTDTNGQNLTDSAPEHFPAHRPSWAAPLQGGTRSSERACTHQEMPSPGGQISGMTSHKNCCDWSDGSGRGIPSTSWRATTRQPGGRARRRTHQFCRGLPPSCRVVGLRQIDGMPRQRQRARSTPRAVAGPSDVEKQ